ncbi:hypothetical protein Hanom_Chr13g01203601 [Helianthus anomalus]
MVGSQWPNQTHAPNPSPTIPHGRGFEWWWGSHSTCQPMPQPKPHHTPWSNSWSSFLRDNKIHCINYHQRLSSIVSLPHKQNP